MESVSTEHLTFERDGATAIVTMNRPEAKNALSLPMLVGMKDAWEEIDGNDDIRCAILTGAGGTFCAGMETLPSLPCAAAAHSRPGRSWSASRAAWNTLGPLGSRPRRRNMPRVGGHAARARRTRRHRPPC